VETDDENDDEWEFHALLTAACELEMFLVNKEENTEKNHWMNWINGVLVLDETRNNEEWKNYKTITTEKQNKPGGAYMEDVSGKLIFNGIHLLTNGFL
jgi:hypothetical protein